MPAIGNATLARPKQPAHRRHPQDENRRGRQFRLAFDLQPHRHGRQQARAGRDATENASSGVGWTRTSRTGPPGRHRDATISLISRSDTGTVAGNPGAGEIAEPVD